MMKPAIFVVVFMFFLMGKGADSMRYELNNEIDVPLSASSIWQVYACKELPKLIVKLLPEVFDRIDYIEGNGGVGTVIRIVFPP
ncbi:hypothetical protein MKW98_016633, partial [Papaver atlanticum]